MPEQAHKVKALLAIHHPVERSRLLERNQRITRGLDSELVDVQLAKCFYKQHRTYWSIFGKECRPSRRLQTATLIVSCSMTLL